jgi:hypothetical protein
MNFAFLILTIYDINKSIKKYIKHNNIQTFIHAKFPDQIDAKFTKYIVPEHIETKWGDISIVVATIALLKRAILSTDLKYFILVSGDTFINPLLSNINTNKSIFEYKNKYLSNTNTFYKSSQWFCIIREDAQIIINTYNKYLRLFLISEKIIKKNNYGAPDELYFLTVLANEKHEFKFENSPVIYTRWISDKVKHPATFNILTNYDVEEYTSKSCVGIRKCTNTVSHQKLKNKLIISVVGKYTSQQHMIMGINFSNYDVIILTPLELNDINKMLLEKCVGLYYFYYGTFGAFKDDFYLKLDKFLKQWPEIIYADETYNYNLI